MTRIEGDLVSPDLGEKVVEAAPDVIVNLASFTPVRFSFDKAMEYGRINYLGTVNLVEAARRCPGLKQFVHSSTMESYKSKSSTISEEDPLEGSTPYGVSKAAADLYVQVAGKAWNLPFTILRCGNSILPDENILCFNDGEMHLQPVAEYANSTQGERRFIIVPSFDPSDHKMTLGWAKGLIEEAYEGDAFVLRTRYGRHVRVTGDHSVFVWKAAIPSRPLKEGVLAAEPVRNLKVGDFVAVPSKLDVFEKDLKEIDAFHYIKPLTGWIVEGDRIRRKGGHSYLGCRTKVTDDLLWVFGFFLAEGCFFQSEDDKGIVISSDDYLLDRAKTIMERDLGIHVGRRDATKGRSPSLRVSSYALWTVFRGLGLDGHSPPTWILQLPLSRLKHLVKGYWEGDGIHKGKQLARQKLISFSTARENVANWLVVALLRFGLLASCTYHPSRFRKKYGNRQFPAWRVEVYRPSTPQILDWDKGVTQRHNARRVGDLVLARITAIAQSTYIGKVYDFSVPHYENFLAGNGVMCHNTFGRSFTLPEEARGYLVEKAVISMLANKEKVEFDGYPDVVRSWLYYPDHVSAYTSVIGNQKAVQKVYNAIAEAHSVGDMVQLIAHLTGFKGKVEWGKNPRPFDPKMLMTTAERIKFELGWRPRYTIAEGLARTVEYWREKV